MSEIIIYTHQAGMKMEASGDAEITTYDGMGNAQETMSLKGLAADYGITFNENTKFEVMGHDQSYMVVDVSPADIDNSVSRGLLVQGEQKFINSDKFGSNVPIYRADENVFAAFSNNAIQDGVSPFGKPVVSIASSTQEISITNPGQNPVTIILNQSGLANRDINPLGSLHGLNADELKGAINSDILAMNLGLQENIPSVERSAPIPDGARLQQVPAQTFGLD